MHFILKLGTPKISENL